MKIKLILFLALALSGLNGWSQCTCSITNPATVPDPPTQLTPTGSWQGIWQYPGSYSQYAVTPGQTYEWSYCDGGASASFDTRLNLYNGTTALTCNSDYCGVLSKITYTVPSGLYNISVLTTKYVSSSEPCNYSQTPSCYLAYRQSSSCALTGIYPTLVSPGTGSSPGTTVSTTTPTLSWNTVSGASNYDVFVSISPYGSSNIVYQQTCVSGTSLTVPSGYLNSGSQYRWNIQANVSCGSCVSSYASPYYFNISNPCTNVSIVSPPQNQTACSNSTATFTVSVNGTPPFNYMWFKGTTLVQTFQNISSTSSSYTTPALTSGDNGNTYSCSINNCSGVGGVNSSNATLTVNPLPIVNFTASQYTIQAGGSVNFYDNSTNSPISWSWNFGGGGTPNTSTSQNPTNIVFNSSGSYTVSLTATNACGSNSSSQTITVSSICNSTAPTSITASPSTPVASGTQVTLTVNGGSLGTGAQWYLYEGSCGGTISGIGSNPYFYPTPTQTTTYFARAEATGCPPTSCASVTVQVCTTPATPVITPSGTVSVCSGQSATLTLSNPCSGCTIHWTQCPTCILESGNPLITNTGGNWYCYEVDACGTSTSNSNTVIVNMVSISVSTTSTDASCGQSNGTASAIPSGGSSPYSYSWSNGQGTQTATGLSAGTYQVTVTDNSGCSSTATATVSNPNSPTVTTTETDPLCYGENNGSATATPTGGATPYAYLWNTTPPQNGATATGLPAGTYNVTVSDILNCNAIGTITLTDPAPITVTITSINASAFGACDGTATAFGGVNYTWSNGATVPTITGLCAGTFSVTATDNNGCQAGTSVTITEPNGISENLADEKIKIFPNPATGNFTLRIDGSLNKEVQIKILNILGEEIFVSKIEKVNRKYSKEISLPNASKGIYLVQVKIGENVEYTKLMIE